MLMKKLSLLIVMILCVTIGSVYATWTYTQYTDVADETVNMSMNLTSVAFSGSYGTYEINTSNVTMTIDPKQGTTHTTALTITGDIVITFTPNTVAPQDIKENGVDSTFQFGLTNANWTFDDDTTDAVAAKNIITLEHTSASNGVFTFTITAAELAGHIHLTEFNLDTKAKYDAFNTALGLGQISITVSDGITTQQ